MNCTVGWAPSRDHLARLGDGLENAVTSYNQAIRSVETRVLVTARRFADLGVAPDGPAPLAPVEALPRRPQPAPVSSAENHLIGEPGRYR